MELKRHKVTLLITLGILVGFLIIYLLPSQRPKSQPFAQSTQTTYLPPSQPVEPIDQAAIRAKAWARIADRLDSADRASLEEIDRSLVLIDEFFTRARQGARPFAEALLSLGGKWRYVKARLPFADGDGHVKFLHEKLEEHLFKPHDLRLLLEDAVASYVTRVRAIENQLLVQIRADLSEGELAAANILPALQSAEVFAQEFARLEREVGIMVADEFNFTLGREVAIFVGSEVAAHVALRVGLAVAQRLGLSAGILGSGAALGWTTFGVGLIAAIALDYVVDGVLRFNGYDPEGQVTAKVNDTLFGLQNMLVNGVPEAVAAYRKLRRLETEDPVEEVRAECREAAIRIDRGGSLGLRHELQRLHLARAKVRREVLRRLVLEAEPIGQTKLNSIDHPAPHGATK